MPSLYFKTAEALHAKHSVCRNKPEPCTKEMAVEFGKIIVAGEELLACVMMSIRCEIICRCLRVEAVTRAEGKRRCDLNRCLKFDSVGTNAPVIHIVAIK